MVQGVDVGRGPGHQLAGLHLVVAGHVEALDVAEQGGAQVVLHVGRHPAAVEAAHVGQGEAGGAGQGQEEEPGGDGVAGAAGDVIDHDLLHQRREPGDAGAQEAGAKGDPDVQLVGDQPAEQPAHPRDPLRLCFHRRQGTAGCFARRRGWGGAVSGGRQTAGPPGP